jgi:hypothetical protein
MFVFIVEDEICAWNQPKKLKKKQEKLTFIVKFCF